MSQEYLISSASMIMLSVVRTVLLKWGGMLPFSDPLLVFFLLFTYMIALLMFWYTHRHGSYSLSALCYF